jgi:DHA1 family tetracycline resistance protein-like MFS transporter
MLTFAFAEYGWMLYLGIIPYTLGGIAGPTVQGIMSNQVPDTEQGELQGALTSLIALTSIIGPVLMTSIFSYFTQTGGDYFIPGAPFILGTVFAGLSLWLVIRALGTLRKSEIRPE